MRSGEPVAVDANVLVYALFQDTPHHHASRALLEHGGSRELRLCVASQVLAEFFSIATGAKRVSDPRTPEEAAAAIESLLAIPNISLLGAPSEVTSLWLEIVRRHPVRGGAIFHLQLVATMRASGAQRICTFNQKDFEGFSDLEILTPSDIIDPDSILAR